MKNILLLLTILMYEGLSAPSYAASADHVDTKGQKGRTPDNSSTESFNHCSILSILFPEENVLTLSQESALGQKKDSFPTVKKGDSYTRIYKVFLDPQDGSIIHVFTETWDPKNDCHSCSASIGYAQLKKEQTSHTIKVNHKIFDTLGEWGRLQEDLRLVLIGPKTHGILASEAGVHQGMRSCYHVIYKLPLENAPEKIFSFFIESCKLDPRKTRFENKKVPESSYFDLVIEGVDARSKKKRIIKWKYDGSTYVPLSKINGYRQTYPE
jgi:hypothetical protein